MLLDSIRPFYTATPLSLVSAQVYRNIFPKTNILKAVWFPTVFCVGSGPSLDHVAIERIFQSTIIFMNSSVQRHEEFRGRGNSMIWFCQDVGAFRRFAPMIPKDIVKVVTVHAFRGVYGMHRWLSRGRDSFLSPAICIGREMGSTVDSWQGPFRVRPRYFAVETPSRWGNPLDCPYGIGPKTVMLGAVSLAISANPARIILLGFDAPDRPSNKAYAQGVSKGSQRVAFPFAVMEWYLRVLKEEAKKRKVELYNWSPLTSETTLERFEPGDQQDLGAYLRSGDVCLD